MSATTVVAIAIGIIVVLAGAAFATLARRNDVRGAGALSDETVARDRAARSTQAATSGAATGAEVEAAAAAARAGTAVVAAGDRMPEPFVPADPEAIGVSRRQFFNRATISLMGAGIGTFAAASFVAFLWPTKTGGFGGKVSIGRYDDVINGIRTGQGFFYAPEARAWITEYPVDVVPKAVGTYKESLIPGLERGIIASYQKCPHLGCRVPQCSSSQWFECGCHGSMYNRVGEKKAGPAPRGLDHFPLEFTAAGEVLVNTGVIVQGVPLGVNTTGQEAEGPHCVGASDH